MKFYKKEIEEEEEEEKGREKKFIERLKKDVDKMKYYCYLQFHGKNGWIGTGLGSSDVALFVADQETIATLVSLLSGTTRYRFHANRAL